MDTPLTPARLASLAEVDTILEDLDEPDTNYLLATERQSHVQAARRALVVIISDHMIEGGEETGRILTELLAEGGFTVDGFVAVRNKKSQIRKAIETSVVGGIDLVLTIGGTGVGPRDKTPEATQAVLDQIVPGVAQALRASGLSCGAIDACTSRGIAGISGQTVVVNLARSRAAIRDGMATLMPLVHHLIDELQQSSVID